MVYCCAIGCKNEFSVKLRKEKGITFHKFPSTAKDGKRRKLWLQNIRRKNFTAGPYTTICSEHFLPEMFDRTGQTTRLRLDAVPTLFNFPPHIMKKYKPRRYRERTPACSDSKDDEKDDLPKKVDPPKMLDPPSLRLILDEHSYVLNDSPSKLKWKLESKISSLKKKLKYEQTVNSKSRAMICSLKAVIKELKLVIRSKQ